MQKPSLITYPGPFHKYIDQVPQEDLYDAFNVQLSIISIFLSSLSEEGSKYAYTADKWTIKEVLQHIIDTERIFSYRALCFSRGEKKILPGFEQNDYAGASNANSRTWHSLGNEFLILRQSTYLLFNSFTEDMLASEGISNSNTNTVAGWGYAIIGHFYHHKKVIEEKYL
ncbi:MAG TPA: DinB family protein [Ferruginibacter sp.]|jgi:hypothetical protein|nr:DinB family protein [Ferruginibacter sp.]